MQTTTHIATVADHVEAVLRRTRGKGADIDTITERVSARAGRPVPRVTVQAQLGRHGDRFRRLARGVYSTKKGR